MPDYFGLLPGIDTELCCLDSLYIICSCLWLPAVDTGLPRFALVCLELS